MGRKIPAKKHRGVKDPLVQQAKRLQGLKGKINAPPRDPDEQPIPKSLLRLFGADKQTEPKNNKLKCKQLRAKRGRGEGEGKGQGSNPLGKLRRLPGESGRAFSRRITGAARALHEATDAQIYPIEEEEEEEPWRRRRRERGGAGAGAGAGRPARAQRRRERLQGKKKEQAEARAGALAAARREVQYERLPFGETAHAPPALPAPRLPAALRDVSVPRPGQRELLLTRLLAGGGGGGAGDAGGKAAAAGRGRGAGADAAGEQSRLAAVAAYRALKASRRAAAGTEAAAGGAAARER